MKKLKTYNILLETNKVVLEPYRSLFLLVPSKEAVYNLKRFFKKMNFNSIYQNDY
tara:strand:- start:264 stop:428 length:165 start_codon:yes stop_codon:yes gene_type:complete